MEEPLTRPQGPDPLDYPLPVIPPLDLDASTPVVALDIDGVLNPLGYRDELPPTAELVTVCIPAWATADASFLVGRGRRNVYPQVVVDRAHGDWIQSLLDRGITVVWCTSWETAAPVLYGPMLGLPPLPVIVLDGEHLRDSADAKAQQLDKLFPARSLVWLDDTSHDGAYLARHPAYPTLVPPVSAYTGLTEDIRDEVEAWLETHPQGFPRYPRELERIDNGQWRIQTSEGSVRLVHDDQNGARLIAGRNLRRANNLPGSLPISGWVDVRLGQPLLTTPVGGGDPLHLGTVTRIECLRIASDVPLWRRQQRCPDLSSQRAAQQLVTDGLQPWPECADISVKDGEAIAFRDGDTALELDLTGDIAVLRAFLCDGSDPDGRWVDVAFERPHRLQESSWRRTEGPLVRSEAATWMLDRWRSWRRQQECAHTDAAGHRFCPDCGTQLRPGV